MKYVTFILLLLAFLVGSCTEWRAKRMYNQAKRTTEINGKRQIALIKVKEEFPGTAYADSADNLLEKIHSEIERQRIERARQDSIRAVEKAAAEAKRKAEIKQKRQELKELKSRFDYHEDSFTGIGWYRHVDIPARVPLYEGSDYLSERDQYIVTPVRDNGYIYIKSVYQADNWIFHQKIAAKIGDRLLYSDEVPGYSENNDRDASGYGITETVHFLQDNRILDAIAKSNTNEIAIRQIGKKYNEFMLTSSEIQAIKDSYRLSELIKEVGN